MHDYFELLSTGVILALNGYLVYNYISLYIKEPPMLTYDDALNLNYYKKTTFTGWMNDMRFLIKREEPVLKEATEDTPEEKGEPIFHAWIWPGPYIFDLTRSTPCKSTTLRSIPKPMNTLNTMTWAGNGLLSSNRAIQKLSAFGSGSGKCPCNGL